MTLKEIFGTNVKQYRKVQGFTQLDLAEKTDLSLDMIGRVERGTTAASFSNIEKISRALKVSEVSLFGDGSYSRPSGRRGSLLNEINKELANMSDTDLSKALTILRALK